MNHAGDPSHQQTGTITSKAKETEGTALVAEHEDTLQVHDYSRGLHETYAKDERCSTIPPYEIKIYSTLMRPSQV